MFDGIASLLTDLTAAGRRMAGHLKNQATASGFSNTSGSHHFG